jgi:outer membrane protein assembly factor BamE (lipoprotein component of BamABCDE complex)
MIRNFTGLAKVLAGGLFIALATGCAPTVDVRGHMPTAEQLDRLAPGLQSRNDVIEILGSPSMVATFGDEVWYYVGEKTERIAFLEPEVLERTIIAVKFDQNGRMTAIDRLGLKEGKEIEPVDRVTPTAGKELTLLEQLLGNMGRFNTSSPDNSIRRPPL